MSEFVELSSQLLWSLRRQPHNLLLLQVRQPLFTAKLHKKYFQVQKRSQITCSYLCHTDGKLGKVWQVNNKFMVGNIFQLRSRNLSVLPDNQQSLGKNLYSPTSCQVVAKGKVGCSPCNQFYSQQIIQACSTDSVESVTIVHIYIYSSHLKVNHQSMSTISSTSSNGTVLCKFLGPPLEICQKPA